MKALAIIIMGSLVGPMLAAGERPSVAPVFSLNQEREPPSRAERYLSDLADASRRARRLGYVFVGLGAAAVVGNLVLSASF
jgi:hypothetical protein